MYYIMHIITIHEMSSFDALFVCPIAIALLAFVFSFCSSRSNFATYTMFANAIKSTIWSVSVKSVRGVNVTRTLATYKSSTGLVGLAVDPNGRETLQDLAATVLSSVKVHTMCPFSLSHMVLFLKSSEKEVTDFVGDCFLLQKIPEHSEYRKNVEKWFTYIAKVADEKKEVQYCACHAQKANLPPFFTVSVPSFVLLSLQHCPLKILEIENELDLGQIEEVITMGKDELELIDYYYGTAAPQ